MTKNGTLEVIFWLFISSLKTKQKDLKNQWIKLHNERKIRLFY